MADQLLAMLKEHFLKKDVGDRGRTISEWSVVEQWFRMEIYLCLRSNGEDWSMDRMPATPDWTLKNEVLGGMTEMVRLGGNGPT